MHCQKEITITDMSQHITAHKEVQVTFAASDSNAITKDYYNFLVGNINRGTIKSAVCEIVNEVFGVTSYHLLTVR